MSNPFKHTVNLPPEQEAIRAKCFHPTGAFVEFHKEEIEQSIPERFEKIVRQHPDRIAIKDGHRVLTYSALNTMANNLARELIVRQGKKAEPVGLLFETGASLVVAMLGVLKAGKFFVVADLSLPGSRIKALLEDARAASVVTDPHHFPLAQELAGPGCPLIQLDAIDLLIPADDLQLPISPEALGFICYTSGSTGQPKGVVWSQRFLLHHEMLHTNLTHVSEHDKLTLLTSGTGNTITNIFMALLNGASLVPFNVRTEGVTCLATWLRDEKITICLVSSALFRNLCGILTGDEEYPDLRLIRLRSESVYKTDIDLANKYFPPECVIASGLSSTETGIIRTYWVDRHAEIAGPEVPVGYAVEDKEVLLLDQDGQKVGFNEIGEIVVRTRYLSEGYWRRPDLTEPKFKPDPEGGDKRLYFTGDLGLMLPDGCLIHKGRKDFRVKIRGYGVELAEVEKALRSHPAVRGAAVIAPQSESGEARLVAYFTSSIQPAPSVSELRGCLRELLPDYMIPSAFVKLESIPLTPNGKLNRKDLPDPEKTRPELDTAYMPPRSEIEQKMVQIWGDVLSVRPVGIHDNFFDLGGHSLLAAKLFVCLDDEFGRFLPISVLFDAPTVRLLAEHYRTSTEPKKRSPVVPLTATGSLPPVYAVPGVFGNVVCFAHLSRELGPEQPFYGLQSVGLDGMAPPLDSIASMARLYVSEIRKVQAHGPYALIGACFGARVAYEMARQLLEAEEEVAFLGLLDPSRREGYDTRENSVSASRVSKRAKVFSGFVTDRLRLYLDEMRGLDRAERIKFVTNKIRSLTLKIGNRKAFTRVQRELHQLEVFKANKEASKRYHRKPLNGRLRALEIFETSRHTTGSSFDWKSLWGGHPIRHHVPGKDSGDMLSGENAGAVAGLLAERLRAAFGEKSRQDPIVQGPKSAQSDDPLPRVIQ